MNSLMSPSTILGLISSITFVPLSEQRLTNNLPSNDEEVAADDKDAEVAADDKDTEVAADDNDAEVAADDKDTEVAADVATDKDADVEDEKEMDEYKDNQEAEDKQPEDNEMSDDEEEDEEADCFLCGRRSMNEPRFDHHTFLFRPRPFEMDIDMGSTTTASSRKWLAIK
jgi:hypothetical protein